MLAKMFDDMSFLIDETNVHLEEQQSVLEYFLEHGLSQLKKTENY